LHAYRNPEHERAVANRLRKRLPSVRLSLSHEVAGEIREYERATTTLANVYVQRLMEGYLGRIEDTLAAAGSPARLLLMLSGGGTATIDTARRFPIRLVESGPAAGALAAAAHGAATGRPNLLSFDMGGTTAKACLITGGIPPVTTEFEVDRVYRFKTGSGLPVRVPSIDLIEIGAGGGSIARVDRFGLIKVGPDSAGADPGPACYGRGGTMPTVTDADLVLGYLDAGHFLGGAMALDLDAAHAAITTHIGTHTGLDATKGAWAIHRVVNEAMAAAARMHAVERGKDAGAVPLFAFGGAGPVHATGVARLLGSREIVVPYGAGVGSTIGFLVAPVSFDFVRSYYARLDAVNWGTVASLIAEMEATGRDVLAAAGINPATVSFDHCAELRLVGQAHQVTVDLPPDAIEALHGLVSRPAHSYGRAQGDAGAAGAHEAIARAFASTYRTLYRRDAPPVAIEAVNWRVVARGPVPSFALPRPAGTPDGTPPAQAVAKGHRPAWWPELGQYAPTAVYDRTALALGMAPIAGPAIVEERESTTIVSPGATALVEASGALVIRLPGRNASLAQGTPA
jgi:N-methylhydantoinase A